MTSGQKRSDTYRRNLRARVADGLKSLRDDGLLPITMKALSIHSGVRYNRAFLLEIPEIGEAVRTGEIVASSRGPLPKTGESGERMSPEIAKQSLKDSLKSEFQNAAYSEDMRETLDTYIDKLVDVSYNSGYKNLRKRIHDLIASMEHTVGSVVTLVAENQSLHLTMKKLLDRVDRLDDVVAFLVTREQAGSEQRLPAPTAPLRRHRVPNVSMRRSHNGDRATS